MRPKPLDAWHKVVETKSTELLAAILDDDVVFHSPVVHTPQRGKPITMKYLSAALKVLNNEHFHYLREIRDARQAVLEFQTEIGGITINGVDLITWNEAGRITDFKVMVRPLKAINLLHQTMGQQLAKAG